MCCLCLRVRLYLYVCERLYVDLLLPTADRLRQLVSSVDEVGGLLRLDALTFNPTPSTLPLNPTRQT